MLTLLVRVRYPIGLTQKVIVGLSKSHRHGSDGAFGEEPLVLLELSVALVSGAAVALVLVRAVLVGG